MFQFSKSDFHEFSKTYKTVPQSTTVFADTRTPIQLFQYFDHEAAFILESNDPLSPWSNYSFIGLNPIYRIESDKGGFLFKSHLDNEILSKASTLPEIWREATAYLNPVPDQTNVPFPGGAVGYTSFESYHLTEDRVQAFDNGEKDVSFLFCETILAYHHGKEELTIVHLQKIEPESPDNCHDQASLRINAIIDQLSGPIPDQEALTPFKTTIKEDVFEGVMSSYTKESFEADVEEVKRYIAQGDIFQAVLSQRFEVPVKSDGLSLYRVLRKVNPSPYLYYIRFPDQDVIGSSPERLLKVDKSGELEIHPIAGTRKRGKDDAEDKALKEELLKDEKERAEHLMLVDLARNDIGRVSQFGTVKVGTYMEVAYFSHVMHIISKVTGQLTEGLHPFDALFATHPAGTVSGAPKVRAVEIIQDLEKQRRGVYAGAIAYCGFNDAIDSCIAIRTMIVKNGTAYVQAGAGIVQDSVPELEYEETRNKAKALLYAIQVAEARTQSEEVNSK
ncbi:anthranilate synthase component I [Salisediminibacterium beveridgei]|uniref:Anthranilate synthase component 1 n=1 Tax=Salisediminibacterium beveridgei TaxID=632773 RepID=A0A1D7QUW3_9BACI|nr:anthranilate synthase component I [Salisediminibacterium beveridgei]AOM82810.1 Anthranilate synthase, aminase component [Salisediminibacterium beveridgei]